MRSRRDILKWGGVTLTVGLAGCSTDGGADTESPDGADTESPDGADTESPDGADTESPDDTDTESSDDTNMQSPVDSGTDTDITETDAGEPEFNIGMIYPFSGIGDDSFGDAANDGITEAANRFNIAFDDAAPQDANDFNQLQTQFAESTNPNYDLIICIGSDRPETDHASPLQDNADEYSVQKWALLNETLPESKQNVESWLYAANEGAYIAGEAAATLSSQDFSLTTGATDPSETTLGFVGGREVPSVQDFEAGFRAGMNSDNVDGDFQLLTSYVGSFDDPESVEEEARSMIDNGADVLLHNAGVGGDADSAGTDTDNAGVGGGGSGLFKACQDRGRFAFGTDARQSDTLTEFSDIILGSIIKGIDQSVINAVETVVNDSFEGGQTHTLTAGEGGFEVPWGVDLEYQIPLEVQNQADQTRQAIADGDIDVPKQQ